MAGWTSPSVAESCAARLGGWFGRYASEIVQSRGARLLVKKNRNGKRRPTLPAVFVAGSIVWQGVDAASDRIYNAEIESQVAANAEIYDRMIDSDFRFHEIKEDLTAGRVAPKDARLRTYWLKTAIDKYYEYRDQHAEEPKTAENELRYIQFFGHLRQVLDNGVREVPGFLVPVEARGRLSDEKKVALVEVNHDLFIRYQLIAEMVNQTADFQELQSHPAIMEMILKLKNDPFVRKIFDLQRQGSISLNEVQDILQEDAFWQARFREWKILGVTKLKISKHGRAEDVPLTLEDIRTEILESLAEHG